MYRGINRSHRMLNETSAEIGCTLYGSLKIERVSSRYAVKMMQGREIEKMKRKILQD